MKEFLADWYLWPVSYVTFVVAFLIAWPILTLESRRMERKYYREKELKELRDKVREMDV